MCSSCRMLLEYCVCQWWQAQVTQSAQVCGRCSTRLRCTASSTSRGWVPASRKVRSTNLESLSGIGGGGQRGRITQRPQEWAPGQPHFLQRKLILAANGMRPKPHSDSFEKCACAECHSNEESSQDALTGGQGVG